jgi:hypothetical protein
VTPLREAIAQVGAGDTITFANALSGRACRSADAVPAARRRGGTPQFRRRCLGVVVSQVFCCRRASGSSQPNTLRPPNACE